MKKVLFVTHYPGIGGANLSMVHLINNLRKYENVDPMVFIPMGGEIEKELKNKEIPYEIHRYLSWRTANGGKLYIFFRSILMVLINAISALCLSHRFRDYDILYANSSKVVFPMFLKKLLHKPVIWHLREFGTIDYPMVFLLPAKLVSQIYGSADTLIAISKEIENYYKKYVCPQGKYRLVYNGIDCDDYENMPNQNANETVRICIVGGVNPSKNQGDLIKAVEICKNNGVLLKVDVLGQNKTKYGQQLQDYCKEKQLEDIVKFKGQVSAINKLLPSYDIGVITSKAEAFGRVIVEYMMANQAVIASNAGACPELIHDKETGFLYELGNSEQLSSIIEFLVRNKILRDEIAKAGNEYAQKHFTAKINAHNIMKVIEEL